LTLGRAFGAAFAIGSAAVVGKSLIKAAVEHQAAFAVLDQTVKNAGVSNDLYGQSLQSLIEKEGRLKGFTSEQLASGFQRLVSVTHDSAKAFGDLQQAEDLARFRHIDLAVAALALSKAEQGSVTALQRYGIVVPQITAATDNLQLAHQRAVAAGAKFTEQQKEEYAQALAVAKAQDAQARRTEALSLIQQRAGGAAATYATTAAGQWDRFRESLHQFEIEVGDHLLPALSSTLEVANRFGRVIGGAVGAIAVYKGVGAAFAATSSAGAAAVGAEAAATTGLTGALVANTAAMEGNNAARVASLTTFGALSRGVSTAETGLVGVAGAEARAGEQAGVAAASASRLTGFLTRLAAFGIITIGIELLINKKAVDQAVSGFLDKHGLPGGTNELQSVQQLKALAESRGGIYQQLLDKLQKQAQDGNKKIAAALAQGGVYLIPAKEDTKLADSLRGSVQNAADAVKTAGHDTLTPAGKSLIQSLVDGIKSDQSDINDLKTQMADAITQGEQALVQAVDQAKQNLNTIGQTLASDIGQIIDKPITDAQQRLTDAQNKLSLSSAKTNLRTLGEEVLLPGGKRLIQDPTKAIRELEQLQKTAHGSPGLQTFIDQYRAAALGVDSAELQIRQGVADKRKTAASQRIADLTDEFNKGQITARQLNVAITRELVKDGASYKTAGSELGVAFADGFQAQVTGLAKQVAAIVGGPQRPGTGLAPSIVRPLETLQQTQKTLAGIASQERAKQLHEAKQQTELLKKIHGSQAGTDYTNSLGRNPGEATKKGQKLAPIHQ